MLILAALMPAALAQGEEGEAEQKEVTIDLREWLGEKDPIELLERFGSLCVEDVEALDKGRPKTTQTLRVKGRETLRAPLFCELEGVLFRALPVRNTGIAVAPLGKGRDKPRKQQLGRALLACLNYQPDLSRIEWQIESKKIREKGRPVAALFWISYRYTDRNPDLELPRRHVDPTRPPRR